MNRRFARSQTTPLAHVHANKHLSRSRIVERDIDLEIEERVRSLTLSASDDDCQENHCIRANSRHVLSPSKQHQHHPRGAKMSVSQRMLQAARRNRLKRTLMTSPLHATPGVIAEEEQLEESDMMLSTCVDALIDPRSASMSSDLDGLVHLDSTVDPMDDWPYLSDDEDNDAMHHSNASHAQSHREHRDRGNSASAFTGRRTYPAESSKAVESRFSERELVAPKPKTKMDMALEHQHTHTREWRHDSEFSPERSRSMTTKDRSQSGKLSISQLSSSRSSVTSRSGRSSCTSSGRSSSVSMTTSLSGMKTLSPAPMDRLAQSCITSNSTSPQTVALSQSQRSTSTLTAAEEREKMAKAVREIENVVQELEQCLTTASLMPMAKAMMQEIDMLRSSLTVMRRRGTTLIFDEMQNTHYESADLLRGIVASAARVQTRVEALSTFVREGPAGK